MKHNDELAFAVSLTLGDHLDDFNVKGICEAIRDEYGQDARIDDVPADDYWEIVKAYDRSDVLAAPLRPVTGFDVWLMASGVFSREEK